MSRQDDASFPSSNRAARLRSSTQRRRGRELPWILTLVLGSGCLGPEEHRRSADEEVYALIDARRDQLFSAGSGFRLEGATDSLRQRILRGEFDSTRPITLAECLEIAAENSRDHQSRKEALYLAALDLTLERWRFANRPFASLGTSVEGTGSEAQEVGAQGEAGITRLLGSGASIIASIGSRLFRVVSTGDGWDAVGDLGLTFTQPLLRGAGAAIVREPLTQAERDLVYEVRAYERFRRTFAVDVARSMYDLLQSIDELANEEQNYQNLVALRERNAAMAEAGRMSEIEADQARQDELRSEARLLELRADLERARDAFNLFLGLPIGADVRLDTAEFERLTEEDSLLDEIVEGSAVRLALEARLDHLNTRDELADRERAVTIAEDALRAGLTLEAGANASGAEGRPLDLSEDRTTWSAGLVLDLPLDRKAERNAYRRALIQLDAFHREFEEEADRIEADVRDALRTAANARENYVIQKGAVQLAESRVEGAKLSLDAGRASTRDLLEAQSALVEAQNAATEALIDFTLARLDLYLQLEALRVEPGGLVVAEDLARTLREGDR